MKINNLKEYLQIQKKLGYNINQRINSVGGWKFKTKLGFTCTLEGGGYFFWAKSYELFEYVKPKFTSNFLPYLNMEAPKRKTQINETKSSRNNNALPSL